MGSFKQILVVGEERDDVLLPSLERAGWQLQRVAELRNLLALKEGKSCFCCLVLADDRLEKQLPRLYSIQAALDLEIVLVLDAAQLERHDIRRFVNECCYDFHHRPVEAERLLGTLGHLHGKESLKPKRWVNGYQACGLIGHHPSIQRLREDLVKIARSSANVLILGESGTGKELVAHSVHQLSGRALGPFQTVNCGGLPASLVQSELFGHEKGAFTGALGMRIGRVEAAGGGTLFLDEIGDMPLEAQANLLRFLQEKTIDRVGSNQSIRIDARVVAATNVDLAAAVATGRFRDDLFYRLNVCVLKLPPLRERSSDILLIAAHMLEQHAVELGVPKRHLSSEAIQALVDHGWPGNVRELSNRISQGLVMASGRYIKAADMGLCAERPRPCYMELESCRERAEREALEVAIALNKGNSSQAARILGISRATLYRLLEKHHLAAFAHPRLLDD